MFAFSVQAWPDEDGQSMETILNAEQINEALSQLTDSIASKTPENVDIAVVGIRSRGEILAQRLTAKLSEKMGKEIPCGVLDVTLYRDDFSDPHGQHDVKTTEIDFDISDKIIILVDDVLYTGRSVRAAMDALVDLGRPEAIRLAVLVDRGHREFPIQADFVACMVDVPQGQTVEVHLKETDEEEQVIVK